MGDPRHLGQDHSSQGQGHERVLQQSITTLYVGNLASRVDEQALSCTFHSFGPITNIQVIRDKNTGHSRGFAFVNYEHPACAAHAMCAMNGVVMGGIYENRTLRVAPSNRAQRIQPSWSWNA